MGLLLRKNLIAAGSGGGAEFNSADTYNTNDIVSYNGEFWKSLVDNNSGNTPSANSTSWMPFKRELSETVARTIYVNASTGNDTTGTGLVGAPFATIIRALKDIKPYIFANITIELSGETHTTGEISKYLHEIQGIRGNIIFTSNSSSRWTSYDTGTMTGNTYFTHTDSTKTWTNDELKGKFLFGASEYFPITKNTGTVISCVGSATFATAAIGAYTIYDHTTVINCSDNYLIRRAENVFVDFQYVKVYSSAGGDKAILDSKNKVRLLSSSYIGGTYSSNAATSISLDSYIDTSGSSGGYVNGATFSRCSIKVSSSAGRFYLGQYAALCYIYNNGGGSQASFAAVSNDLWYTPSSIFLYLYDTCFDNFKYVIDTTDYSASTIKLADTFDYVNVDFFIKGNEGLLVYNDNDFPVYALNASNLNTGLLTEDGVSATTAYIDLSKGRMCPVFGNNVFVSTIKSGATQVAATAAAGELWKTSGHATLPDNVILIGV